MFQVPTARVLIMGGTNEIGAALAEHFIKAGAEVLITGRDAIKLEKLRLKNPKLLLFQSDISTKQFINRYQNAISNKNI